MCVRLHPTADSLLHTRCRDSLKAAFHLLQGGFLPPLERVYHLARQGVRSFSTSPVFFLVLGNGPTAYGTFVQLHVSDF